MSIDISHLVLVAFRNPDDQIVDEGFHGPQSCNVLSRAMVQFDDNGVFCRI